MSCIIIPILVGLISALLGYLLGKLLGGGNNDNYTDKIAGLEADLEACRNSKSANLGSSFAASAPVILFDADAAKAAFGKRIKENDLTIIEGIGPKIQELFHNHDVRTWKSLSECSLDKCQRVLDSGGERFKIHNPGTWAEQAKMAYEGKWRELFNWQEELDGGK